MPDTTSLDALVVGTGFGGIYQLYSLLKLGMNCKAIDTAADVGGTWYWNRYPGAMSDSYSHIYRYSWDKEDLQTYPWPRNYVTQPEILRYLNHVVDKHGLRKHMQFSTELVAAQWDDASQRWLLECSTGDTFSARYVITSLGLLTKKKDPGIPGALDGTFRGKVMHSSEWDPNVDITGQRVGLIGCGSTGIQITVAIADKVKELRAFIRHPQYTVPAGLREVSDEERQKINQSYEEIFRQTRESQTAFAVEESQRKTMSVSPEERQETYERLWAHGNAFHFMFGGFGDITTDPEANEELCRFLRRKIAQVVRDPAKAAVLTPTDYYARRPPCDNGYYECFNRPHVLAVDVGRAPIERVEAAGVRTADGALHELDVLVLATGFDAVDGSYAAVRGGIRGRGGALLADHWAALGGPSAYLGLFAAGFPNLFLVNGPQGPFCNQPTSIEIEVDFVARLLEDKAGSTIEVGPETEAEWVELCRSLASGMLFDKVESNWITGQNIIPGARPTARFYYAGVNSYIRLLKEQEESDYQGLQFS